MTEYKFYGTYANKIPVVKSTIVDFLIFENIDINLKQQLLAQTERVLNPDNQATANDVCSLLDAFISKNPYVKPIDNPPLIKIGILDKNVVANFKKSQNTITFNKLEVENFLQLNSYDARFKKLCVLLEAIGHEYDHFLQYRMLLEDPYSYTKNAVMYSYRYSVRMAERYPFKATPILNLINKLSINETIFPNSEQNLQLIAGGCYCSYPYEQDARIAGCIFLDYMTQEMFNKTAMNYYTFDRYINQQFCSPAALPLEEAINRINTDRFAKLLDVNFEAKVDGIGKRKTIEELFLLYCAYASKENMNNLFSSLKKLENFQLNIVYDYAKSGWNKNAEFYGRHTSQEA